MLNHCPSRDRLRHYLSESLGDAEQVEIDQHLEGCGSCDAVMLEISGSPEVDRWLSLMDTRSYGAEPAVDRSLVRKLRELGHEDAASEGELAFPMPPDQQGPLGRVGHYHFIERVGSGGMGIVYKVLDDRLNRIVAIKVLAPELATVDSHRQQFKREASRAARVKHDDIVSIHDVDDGEGFLPFLVMEWIEGGTLADRIKQSGAIGSREAAKICQEVADGLAVAHQAGLVHRDIKSSNIMLDANSGRARITDFGLARAVDDPITQTSSAAGTPAYMSFEQVRSPAEIDGRSDLYSLGVVLYESVTGERPFRGVTNHDILMQVVHEEPRPPRQLNRAIPRDLETICLKCLEKDPAKRYATADELAEDLGRFLDGREIKARPAGTVEKAVRWARRKPWQAAAVGLLVCLLVLAGSAAVVANRVAIREAGLRQEAEDGRKRAEKTQRLAETRQTQYLYNLAAPPLKAGDLQRARETLSQVPADSESWETRHLQYVASMQPKVDKIFAEGHWGILDGALSPDESQLVTCDASGLVLVWDLQTGKSGRPLAEGRFSKEKRRPLHHFETRSNNDLTRWGRSIVSLDWAGKGSKVAAASLDGAGLLLDCSGEAGTKEARANPASDEILKTDEPLYAVAASSDGNRILFGSATGKLFLQSAAGKALASDHLAKHAVTTLAYLPSTGGWIVGHADGQIRMLAGDGLEQVAEARVPGPVWDFDIAAVEDQELLAVGCETPQIRMFEFVAGERQLKVLDPLLLDDVLDSRDGVHAVRFADEGKVLLAAASNRLLIRLDRETGAVKWTVWGFAGAASLRREKLRRGLKEDGITDLTVPFLRTGSVIFDLAGQQEFITAGVDAVVKLWTRIPATLVGTRKLQSSAGRRPKISFSSQPQLLWALDEDGFLRAIDVATDKVVDRKEAHKGGSAGIAILRESDVVVTVGGDKFVRFWSFDNQKIIPAGPRQIKHRRGLRSVAASHSGRWVAAVDEEANLVVWDVKTTAEVYLRGLTEAEDAEGRRPLTGKVAFNLDDTKLAAFGSGQKAFVFSTNPFDRLADHIWVAGTGGTALGWSPKSSDVVMAADDYPRLTTRVFNVDELDLQRTYIEMPATFVSITSTPDNRRVVILDQQGRLVFLESEHLINLLELQSVLTPASDLAFDRSGSTLVVAGEDGSLEAWLTAVDEPEQATVSEDATDRWSSKLLVEPTANVIRADGRGVQIDSQGRLGLFYIESIAGDFRNEGAPHFVRDDTGYGGRERIEVDGNKADRRVTVEAMTLAYEENDEPLVVYRRRTAVFDQYDGTLQIARRRERNDWRFETIHGHGNLGFYPMVRFDERRNLREVVHFYFGDFSLIRSTPADGGWNQEFIGQQGDGMYARGKWDGRGQLHMTFKPNRFNADPSPYVYAVWDGATLERDRIDATRMIRMGDIEFLADGSPVVAVGDLLMRKTDEGWAELATLPKLLRGDFAIGRKGEIYFVTWEAAQARLLLWQRKGNRWLAKTIAKSFPEGTPNWWAIRLDRSDRPVIVVGKIHEPYGWIRVLRPNG